jgi:hypothetical protein
LKISKPQNPNLQGLTGDGHDHDGARTRPQNDPWGTINSARKKKKI